MFCLLLLRDSLRFKGVDDLVVCHIDKEFPFRLLVFCLHYESLLWLDDGTSFRVDVGLRIRLCLRSGLLSEKLVKQLSHLW